MSGKPKFKYLVPFKERDGEERWYIIITSTGRHFYFNKITKKSYWQLSDLFSIGVDESIINNIDYDEVSTLVAKANGLKLTDDRAVIQKANEAKAGNVDKAEDIEVASDKEDFSQDDTYVQERDTFLSDLLKEEGYLAPEKEAAQGKDSAAEPELDTGGTIGGESRVGLALGYSSSEDEDESEEVVTNSVDVKDDASRTEADEIESGEKESGEKEAEEKEAGEKEEDGQGDNSEDLHSSTDVENDLDLDLSDDDLNGSGEDSSAFNSLLDSLESKISIYDPWFLVEEELLDDFIKDSRYYSVESTLREELFNSWVKSKADSVDIEEHGENINEEFQVKQVGSPSFPTSIQLYLKFLQENKDKTKQYYVDFKREMRTEIENFSSLLSEAKCEGLFREYSLMLKEFRVYEKSEKKKNPKLTVNLKKKSLLDFLEPLLRQEYSKRKFNIDSDTGEDFVRKMEVHIHGDIEDEAKCYRIWFLICNYYSIPKHIAESTKNYIVGPQKRVEVYYEVLKQLYRV
ncbi:hypothetical protein CLIB1423_02S05622 [[Candida] railenensis]|uniref:WW domain-containing protein n=1 Tax=[Candida] railenensis TaxID=45579 RepID=A0A9P0VWV9_9ASCO|nr:hypothetical protein CLIB1423_02S05622 [[Candida] railenensis]